MYFSHQWRDNLIAPIGFIELFHSEEVAAREAADARLPSGNLAGQLIHRALAPLGSRYAAADDLTNFPVKLNQGGINRLYRPLPRGANQSNDSVNPASSGPCCRGLLLRSCVQIPIFTNQSECVAHGSWDESCVACWSARLENRAREQLGSNSLLTTAASDAF